MLIIKTKKDLTAYVDASPLLLECKRAYKDDELEEYEEIKKELVGLLAVGEGSPDFGDDWEEWLEAHLDEMLREAIDIVM